MSDFPPQLRRVAIVGLLCFAVLALAAGYWQILAAPRLQQQENPQAAVRHNLTQPGNIYAADGSLILGAEKKQGTWQTTYPEPEVFCHLTGYNQQTGLQAGLQEARLGLGRYANPWQRLVPGRLRGCDVYLTIDAAAQRTATQALRGHRGAIVALDPRDGAIKVLASAPTYDPEALRSPELYEIFSTDPYSPELNRPLEGLYTPGAVLEIMTAAIGLESGVTQPDEVFSCSGEELVAGTRVVCWKETGHGRLRLIDALAQSCNIVFAKLGKEIGARRFRQYTKSFHLLDVARIPLPSSTGRMADLLGPKGGVYLVHTACGQGATRLTPLSIARLMAALARGGEVIQPYLVAEVRSAQGRVLERGQGEELGRAISAEAARQVAGMMREAVETGTAEAMQLPGVEVAAKTGTAGKRRGKPDCWMVAFAPVDEPVIAVAVVIEAGESGAETAGPMAREVLQALRGG